jgi:hypothetical protein
MPMTDIAAPLVTFATSRDPVGASAADDALAVRLPGRFVVRVPVATHMLKAGIRNGCDILAPGKVTIGLAQSLQTRFTSLFS